MNSGLCKVDRTRLGTSKSHTITGRTRTAHLLMLGTRRDASCVPMRLKLATSGVLVQRGHLAWPVPPALWCYGEGLTQSHLARSLVGTRPKPKAMTAFSFKLCVALGHSSQERLTDRIEHGDFLHAIQRMRRDMQRHAARKKNRSSRETCEQTAALQTKHHHRGGWKNPKPEVSSMTPADFARYHHK